MALVDLFDNFLFDLDGCLYLGDRVIPAAPPTLRKLRRLGKGILFLTNNPRKSREGYAAKLRAMGIEARAEEIVTCSWATAQYLKKRHRLEGKTVFVVGGDALKQEMRDVGLRVVEEIEEARKADFVVVGGHDAFDYREMTLATFALQGGAVFYTTNRDPNYPTPIGIVPGTGAILASLEVASERTAVSIGKPEPPMIEVARSVLRPGRTIIVGDRLSSDIEGGRRAGIATALVLTGITTREEAQASEVKPDHVLENVGALLS